MGKYSDFERIPRDLYPTPYQAVLPLIPHLRGLTTYAEICAGNEDLIYHLNSFGTMCTFASDIEPTRDYIQYMDATQPPTHDLSRCDFIVTNPPWDRKILHAIIENYRKIRPLWLLFDADWAYTTQKPMKSRGLPTTPELLQYCQKIVTVGRVSWQNNGVSGKENCAWYLFGDKKVDTIFYGKS